MSRCVMLINSARSKVPTCPFKPWERQKETEHPVLTSGQDPKKTRLYTGRWGGHSSYTLYYQVAVASVSNRQSNAGHLWLVFTALRVPMQYLPIPAFTWPFQVTLAFDNGQNGLHKWYIKTYKCPKPTVHFFKRYGHRKLTIGHGFPQGCCGPFVKCNQPKETEIKSLSLLSHFGNKSDKPIEESNKSFKEIFRVSPFCAFDFTGN